MPRRALVVFALLAFVVLTGCLHVHLPESLHPVTTASQVSTSAVYGRREVLPGWTQIGVFYDVASCLGVQSPLNPSTSLSWSIADSIKSEEGFYAYGATVLAEDGSTLAEVIIEKSFWWHPSVLSHEFVHVLMKDPSHEGPSWGCVIAPTTALPERPIR